jgi:Amt family ammonium transporter
MLSAGDISWMIMATAMVMLMTPALGFFYAGLVQKRTWSPHLRNVSQSLP